MIELSESSYYAYLFPAFVLLLAIVWNLVKHISFIGGFSKIAVTFCVSMLCLLIIFDMFVTVSPSKVPELPANSLSETTHYDSQEYSKTQLLEFFNIIWLGFMTMMSILTVIVGCEKSIQEKMDAFFGITKVNIPDESKKPQV